MSDKLLSVIVPACDLEALLPKCLGSLAAVDAELTPLLEVVVVNDGSTDRTGEVAHAFAERRPEAFRVIDKSNGHYGSCVNAALRQISGRYVKVVDADDTVDPAGLSALLRALAAYGGDGPDVVFTDYQIVDARDGSVETRRLAFPADREFGVRELSDAADCVYMYSVAYRTGLFREFPYRQTEGICYTDAEWIFMPMAHVRRCRYLAATVYRYLVGRDGQSVGPAEFVKNCAMLERVASGMFAFYDRHRDDEGVASGYLRKLLGRLAVMLSGIKLFHLSREESVRHLEELRRLCASYPFVREALDRQAVFERSPCPFHYLRFALGHRRLGPFALAMTRRYVRFRHRGRGEP